MKNTVVMDQIVIATVSQFLTEASHQFSGFTFLIEIASAAFEAGGAEGARRLADEAGKRLSDVKLLVADIQDWALYDSTGLLASHCPPIISALAEAEAEFERVMTVL